MVLKSGTIIPFQFKDLKKLIAIVGADENNPLTLCDVKNAVHTSFTIQNCEFFNKKIGFPIPDELLVPYLEQCNDLTNLIIEIVAVDEVLLLDQVKRTENYANAVKIEDESSTTKETKRVLSGSFDDDSVPGEKKSKMYHDKVFLKQPEDHRIALSPIKRDKKEHLLLELCRLTDLFPFESTLFTSRRYLDLAVSITHGNLRSVDHLSSIMATQIKIVGSSDGWKSYFKTWQDSYEVRKQHLRVLHRPMEYFDKFIAIARENVPKLLDYDFERLHPGRADKLLENWDKLSDIVFTEAIASCLTDVPMIMDIYGSMSHLCGFMMLGYFLENYENDVVPFKKDSFGNLVVHLEAIDGRPVDVFRKYFDKRELFHPMTFVVGANADQLSFYVLVGDNLYSMETALKAIDFCFKCFQTMAIPYPKEQTKLWQVLQSALYGIRPTILDPECEKFLNIFESS